MPNYSEYVESVGTGASQIDVKYEITDNVTTVSYPNGTYDSNTSSYINVGTASGKIRGYSGSDFRQFVKVPNAVTIDPCDSSGQTWYVSGYSNETDRIVYVGEDLTEKLENNYTGCCFDENGNQVSEPSLNQARTMDIVLEGLQFDTYGKFTYASMPNDFYKQGCTTVSVASITRSETFTVTFESMTPNIASSAPYLDDDVTVTLERSDGTSVTATSSTGTVTLSATAPQTIKIKIGGEFGKKLFPEETWEYYYEKNSEFTANPNHLNFEIDVPERGQDPNDFVEPYRIDKDNNSGQNLNDVSQEVPTGVSLLKFEGDRTDRSAGTSLRDADGNPEGTEDYDSSTATLSRAGHRDIVFNFTVTSSIPALTTTAWAIGTPLATGSYCTNGGSTYYVELGGTPSTGNPGAGIPADVGPSGTSFFIDNSGMRYRYIPPEGLVTTAGAGSWSTTLYVMNDYRIGQERFNELLDAAEARREPKQ